MLVALLSLCPFAAAEVRSRMLTTAPELAARLNRPETVILHIGTETDYAQAHVPGARLLKISDISKEGTTGLRVEMPPPDNLRATLWRFGVRDHSSVILYGPEHRPDNPRLVHLRLSRLRRQSVDSRRRPPRLESSGPAPFPRKRRARPRGEQADTTSQAKPDRRCRLDQRPARR